MSHVGDDRENLFGGMGQKALLGMVGHGGDKIYLVIKGSVSFYTNILSSRKQTFDTSPVNPQRTMNNHY